MPAKTFRERVEALRKPEPDSILWDGSASEAAKIGFNEGLDAVLALLDTAPASPGGVERGTPEFTDDEVAAASFVRDLASSIEPYHQSLATLHAKLTARASRVGGELESGHDGDAWKSGERFAGLMQTVWNTLSCVGVPGTPDYDLRVKGEQALSEIDARIAEGTVK